ncbi:MAG: isoprenylcysteine carboxylmethyltransferase family protein [Chloroflexi bacterium]|nr:isoprenylcysteine carboxylmethyltransferase family protein [Chloroflexota bacterium]
MTTTSLSKNARVQMLIRALLAPIAIIILIFLAAGRWNYWQAWVYIVLNTVIVVLMGTVFTKDSRLIEERLNPKGGTKPWDKVYFAITVPLYFVAIILGGLDARFGWTKNMPLMIYWGSVAVYLIGQSIFLWARYTNSYFSSVVRIQTDRGQTVCKDGPYRYVRHPGYVGGFLFTLTSGLMLGSWWAFILQAIAASMIIWRTALEDKTLQAELPGYAEYAKETRYRLIPGIW